MQSFALALLAATSYAATGVEIKDVIKATGRVGHIVEGSAADMKLILKTSMDIRMLKDEKIVKNEIPYGWMCTQYAVDGTDFDCNAFKFEREVKSDKTKTAVKMTQITIPNAGAKIDATEAKKYSSITGYWDSLSGTSNKKTIEAKSDKAADALATKAGKSTAGDFVAANCGVGEKRGRCEYTEQVAKSKAVVDAVVKANKPLRMKGFIGAWYKDADGKKGVYMEKALDEPYMDAGAFAYGMAGLTAAVTALAF